MAYLKKPGKKRTMSKGGGATSCPALATEKAAAPAKQVCKVVAKQVSQVVPPEKGWLHMDVLEKDKLEWTTDVPPASSKPAMVEVESRFSLDGMVISRSEDVPFHLGLHHHGDEPEVSLL